MADGHLSGEIMEISGLGQASQDKAASDPIIPLVIAGVGIAAFISWLLARQFSSGSASIVESPLAGLGIIKRCRRVDMKSDRGRSFQRWCLWDSKGKRILGRHPSRSKAIRQERLIHARKRGGL